MFESVFSAVELPTESIRHEKLQRLLAFWDAERQPHPWLPFERLRPERFAYVLADVALLERMSQTNHDEVLVRLAGEAVRVDSLGFVRGRSSAEFRPSWFRDHMIDTFRRAFTRAAPVYETVTLTYAGQHYHLDRLLLPLSRNGAAADHLLMAAVLSQPLIELKATAKGCFE